MELLDDGDWAPLWWVRLDDGPVVLGRKAILADRLDRDKVIAELRLLHDLRAQHVEPVTGTAGHGNLLWVLTGSTPRCSLARLLDRGGVTTIEERVSLALDVLAGLAELHSAGLGHPDPKETTVQVDTRGQGALSENWRPTAALAPGPQLRQVGRLLCRMLRISPVPGRRLTRTELDHPALVAEVRAIAAGGERTAAEAFEFVVRAAGPLALEETRARARAVLGRMVKNVLATEHAATEREGRAAAQEPADRRVNGPATPAVSSASSIVEDPVPLRSGTDSPSRPRDVPVTSGNPPAERRVVVPTLPSEPEPRRDRWWQRPQLVMIVAGLLGLASVLLLALVLVPVLSGSLRAPGPTNAPPTHAPTVAPTGVPTPYPTPSPPPTSNGAITSVLMTPKSNCAGGSTCAIRVDVHLQPPSQTTDITWTFRITDACRGVTTEVTGASVPAQPGWDFVFATTAIQLPETQKLWITALTSTPAVAGSVPMLIGGDC